MIDTHCHLDVTRFDADREAVLERAWAAGISGILVPAIGPSSWEPLLEWPSREPRVQVALGIHPQLLPDLPEEHDQKHLAKLEELLKRGLAVAVGECGVEKPSAAAAPMERQLHLLRAHFELAIRFDLPVIVHCLRAHPQLQAFLKTSAIPPRGILLHSYSGSHELVKFYLSHNCSFSLAGPVTFPEARRSIEALRAIPPHRLMLETDAPDQSPHPFRGTRSEPSYLPKILEAVARATGRTEDQIKRETTDNARQFFACWASDSFDRNHWSTNKLS